MKRKYGFWNLMLDMSLTVLTGGVWLIVLFLIHLGNNRKGA